MKRVAIIAANSLRWEPRAAEQARSLAQHGYDVTMFGVRDWDPNESTPYRPEGARVVLVPARTWASVLAVMALVLPTVLLGGVWLLYGSGIFLHWPHAPIAQAAGAGSALGVASAFLLVAQSYVDGCRGDETRPGARALSAILDTAPIRRGVSALRSRLSWPLIEAVSAVFIVMRAVRLNPSVVHCHDIYTLRIGALIKKRTGAALIYDAHEIYEHKARRSTRDARRYRCTLTRYAHLIDGFVSPNAERAAYYTQRHPDLPAPAIVPNAKRPNIDLVHDGRLHRAAGLPPTQKILLYAGAMIAERGLEKLVEVGFQLPSNWTVVIMGHGSLYGRLVGLAQDMAASLPHKATDGAPRVKILPPVAMTDLPAWIGGATLGFIPHESTCLNHDLNMPHKLWDYGCVGVPMLAIDVPLVAKAVRSTGMGWVIPADSSPQEIAAIAVGLSGHDIAVAKQGCVRFMEQEGWSVHEPRLLKLYNDVLQRVGKRRGVTTPPAPRRQEIAGNVH